ncbi:hypothetical protein [Actinoplanes siamensis]|uniref:Uncharacterized protein n=1 Tax=Actinoplanes siamensis TaxID=1223317 RepID=A0A919TIZ1_9ACTN|nr:hypothetical protein [Actinoplanes siamensis]GIF04089.1 hypothetical protein Asi03nite_16270 [Actinoplanes siamensis]
MNLLRIGTAAALATAGLAAGLPGVAQAKVGDHAVKITVVNDSSYDFTRARYRVTEGGWDVRPFKDISAGDSDWFRTVSDEEKGGTAGNITFRTEKGEFTITWLNPYGAPNEFYCTTTAKLSCDDEVIDNSALAEVKFTIG